MSRKIKLLWDFRGEDAKQIAQHHTVHLKEFAALEKLDFHEINISEINPVSAAAFIIVDESNMKIFRNALKPHRGEIAE